MSGHLFRGVRERIGIGIAALCGKQHCLRQDEQRRIRDKGFPSRGSCHGIAQSDSMTDEVCGSLFLLLAYFGEFVLRQHLISQLR